MDKNPNYSLKEISEWAEKNTVSLPKVQRGFVWKPYQIENLWDSLLRGYPIGAFVLSPRHAEAAGESKFEMLDGQQRATAICLGFGKETFKDSQDKIKVFIDLEKPKGEDNRKYIFRVITKSHPWGYQRTDNTKTLESKNIRKAMNMYKVEDHLEATLGKFFPYDAIFPVPFHFFTVPSIRHEELKKKIKEWEHYEKIFSRNKEERQKDALECITEEKIFTCIDEIFELVKTMLDNENGQKVPALYLDFEMFKRNPDYSKSQNTDYDQADIDENSEIAEALEEPDNITDDDEIENLFIRLNAGGTPLSGEELNYSVLKAKIPQTLQDKIEKCCEGIFKPSRFITIAYRLFQNQQKEESRDAITMRIKPKQFQKTISKSKRLRDFQVFLENVLDKKEYDNNNKTLLKYTRHLLEYNNENNTYGLPYLIIRKLADNAPGIMFMLLYRLLIKKDQFDFETDLHKKMLGMITLFVWLGKGEKQKDHAKLLSNIWPCVKIFKKELFWSSSTVQRALLDDILTPFPPYEGKKNNLSAIKKYYKKNTKLRTNTDITHKYDKDTGYTGYRSFIDKMFFNNELILYAQREFLSNQFKQNHYCLDDTNVPFDWDHISANKYVKNKRKIPLIIKDWYSSIGNLRAWPYSLNRIDQDVVPPLKLDPLGNNNAEKNSEDDREKIKELKTALKKPDLPDEELKKELLKASFCDKEWCYEKWAKYDEQENIIRKDPKKVFKLIMDRNLSICKEWYTNLNIEELLPSTNKKENFSSVIDGRKWISDKKLKRALDIVEEGRNCEVSKPIKINKTSIYIYFTYDENQKEVLQEDNIEFGICEKNTNGFISKLKISDKDKQNYYTDRANWVQRDFTLVSFDEDSYAELFKNFQQWLKKFPNKDVQSLADTFIGSLVKDYQNRIKELEQK